MMTDIDASTQSSQPAPSHLRSESIDGRDPGCPSQPERQSGGELAHEVFNVCKIIGQYQKVDFVTPPVFTNSTDPVAHLTVICAANGIKCRKATLPDNWWTHDYGSLFGILQTKALNKIPIALIRKHGKYIIKNVNTESIVNPDLYEHVSKEAYILYRPFPLKPLSWRDLVGRLSEPAFDWGRIAFTTLAAGALGLIVPMTTRHVVDSCIPLADTKTAVLLSGMIGLSGLLQACLGAARGNALMRVRVKGAITCQAALWERLLTLPANFFRKFTAGDLTARSMGIELLEQQLTSDITSSLFMVAIAATSIILLFMYNYRLAFVVAALSVLYALITTRISRKQSSHLQRLQEKKGELASLTLGIVGGITRVRTNCAEKALFDTWQHKADEELELIKRSRQLSDRQILTTQVYAGATLVGLLVLKALGSRAAGSQGTFVAFIAAFLQLEAALSEFSRKLPSVLAIGPTYQRLRPLIASAPECNASAMQIGRLEGHVEFRNVTFSYDGRTNAVDGISFTIPSGKCGALVGSTASGKSTCLRLLLGFDFPQHGEVLIDGVPTPHLDMRLVRRQFGVVMQNGKPLVGTILQNIVGGYSISVDEAWEALALVGLEDDVDAMPMGIFTSVNHKGMCLSGGQRQKLLLARAIAKRPRVLILDEATSSLDGISQDRIVKGLDRLGVTRIVVAHRLSTIQHADQIHVLSNGAIIENGSYDYLIEKGHLFSRLVRQER